MTDDDKPLEFKHAHITGKAMRDHWGPIVDRIAAETADWRDEWIYDLITENEKLREALKGLLDLDQRCGWHSKQADAARAALGETK